MKQNVSLILHFFEIRAADLPLVGGKGANLGELTHARFPVPPGFCLTTNAFRQFIEACPDSDELYKLLNTVTPEAIETVRDVGERVRNALLALPMPPEVAEAVRGAWQAIGPQYAYAVRSSATAEDLPDASFAGQQDTYLNIIGEADLLDAIRRCWVSLFTDRAIVYRARNGFPHRGVELSVIVQQMVMAEKSGTLFTADPLSGQRQTVAIDASFGLGEALVGGLVSPDTYRVDKRTHTITDRQIADKQIGIFPKKDGGTRQVTLDEAQRKETVLIKPQILALTDLGISIEAHFGQPQDIEWAIVSPDSGAASATRHSPPSHGKIASSTKHPRPDIFILQSRPITSLYPIGGLQSPDDTLHVYFSMGHQQSMTRAMAPLSLSSIQVLIPIGHDEDRLENAFLRTSGGRLYADITTPLRHPVLRRAMLGLLSQLDALAPEAVKQVMQRPEFGHPHGLRPSFAMLKGAALIMRRVLGALWWRDLTGFVARINALMDDFMDDVSGRLLAVPPGRAQLQAVLDTLPALMPFFLNWVPEAAAGVISTRLLTRLAQRWLTQEELEALTLGIPGNVVNEMNLAIGDLADLARGCPELAAAFDHLGDDGHAWLGRAGQIACSGPFLKAWDAFIDRYGMRGPAEIDIMMPRWYEDPLSLLQVIASTLQNEGGSYRARQRAFIEGRQVVFQKLLDAAGSGLFGWLRIRLFKRLYYTMTEVGGMREHHKFLAVRMLGVVKNVLKKVALQLVEEDKLAQPEDLWFLTWRDLLAIWDDRDVDWRSLIVQRRADLKRYQKLTPPPIITSDGEAPTVLYRVEDAPSGALLGNPVSQGVTEGVAHVIRDPQREMLSPGEILVVEFTDPGWTPLFINAGGLILEVGGALTHGAVVAREYGIPALVGVRNATSLLQTGQKVRIDGNRGFIEIL